MRFVWAVLAFVLATLLIGAGIAQRTIFIGPKTQQVALSVDDPQAYTLVDGAVLRTQPGAQTLLVRGEGEIFTAYGRTADLKAWLSDARYTAITVDDADEIVVGTVEPAPEVLAALDEGAVAGEPRRDPSGSDLWLDEFTDEDALIADMQLPEGMSVLIARDGIEPAPTDISVSWPLDNSTPWAGPLLVAGSILMLIGLLLYIHAFRVQRRGRGPRRKGLGPLPQTEPIDMIALEEGERSALEAGPTEADADDAPEDATQSPASGGRAERRRSGRGLALPALGLSFVLLMTGCSADSWPQFNSEETPSPSPTVIAPENQQSPAVTESQATRILQKLAATVAQADEELDLDLLATRMSGMPLAERTTDYTLREEIEDRAAPAAIPSGSIPILLPQAQDSWPRTVLLLSQDANDDEQTPQAPVIMTLVQDSPWVHYRLTYMAEMQASASLPDLSPSWLGTQLIPPDSPFLSMSPADLAAAFADVIDTGQDSEFAARFDATALGLASAIQESRDGVVKDLEERKASDTSKAEFATELSDHAPVSLGTLESGAIVAIDLYDTETVTPTVSDAVIKLEDNAEAVVLTGVTEAAKGVKTRYSLQVFFAVPSQGSSEPIRLLAARQMLLSVEVIK